MVSSQLEMDVPPTELASRLLAEVRKGIEYARRRKRTFGRKATVIRLITLGLSATSTVILGLQELNVWASIAFSLVALTTLAGAIEPFFNWRSRWIVMEDMNARFRRLESDLEYFLAKTKPEALRSDDLDEFFVRNQEIWIEGSEAWLASRRSDQQPT
jgi:hypothetical protein